MTCPDCGHLLDPELDGDADGVYCRHCDTDHDWRELV